MTRKEELKRRALSFLADEHVEPSDLTAMLLQVEREVLQRVDTYYSHHIHHDMDDYPDRFVKWLRAQQKELT